MSRNFDIEINSNHQLLDLNNDLINFDLNFKVTTNENDEFEALVMTKTDLDKYQDLNDIEMKTAPGVIKGNIRANDNVYQNYFLILRKLNGETKAKVEIDLETIEYIEKSESSSSSQDNIITNKENKLLTFYNNNFYHILFALVLGIVGFYLYKSNCVKFLTRKNLKTIHNVEESTSVDKPVVFDKPVVDKPVVFDKPVVDKSVVDKPVVFDKPVVDKTTSETLLPVESSFSTSTPSPIKYATETPISEQSLTPTIDTPVLSENVGNYLTKLENESN